VKLLVTRVDLVIHPTTRRLTHPCWGLAGHPRTRSTSTTCFIVSPRAADAYTKLGKSCSILLLPACHRGVSCCNGDMSLDELRALLDRHARPDLATAIDGVRLCKVDYAAAPESSMSGTVLAVIPQGGKRLALGDRFYGCGAGQYLVASVDVPVTGHVIDAASGNPRLASE
jgi:AraC-type transcriptional regulator N-terminus